MSEEKPPSAARIFLSQHGEKLFLGVACAALVGYVVVGILAASPNPIAVAVETNAQEIETHAAVSHDAYKPTPPFHDGTEKTKEGKPIPASELHESQVLASWEHLPPDTEKPPGGDWATTLLTQGIPKENRITKEPEAAVVLPSVALDKVDVNLEGVKISWTVKEVKTPDDKTKVAKIDQYLIERKNLTSNKTETFPLKDGGATSYVDKTVAKKTKYEYRVIPVTQDEAYRKQHSTDRGGATKWLTATTLNIWEFGWVNPLPNPKGKGMVGIKIRKFDEKHGELTATKIHYEGDKIGWWEEEVEEKEVDQYGRETIKTVKKVLGTHKMNLGNREVDVDLDTKCKLESVKEIVLKVPRTRCKTKTTSTGATKCEGQIKDEVEVKGVKEIVYLDEDGKPVSIKLRDGAEIQDPKALPGTEDDLCPDHGGKPKEVDPEKEKREQAERDARSALATAHALERSYREQAQKAEKLEKDGKTQEAQKAKQEADETKRKTVEKYKEFLEKFKDTRTFKQEEKKVRDAIQKLGG